MAQTQQRVREPKTGTKLVEGIVVGRDKKVIPPAEVYKLAQIGCKDNEIASWFDVDDNTLRYGMSLRLASHPSLSDERVGYIASMLPFLRFN